MAASRDDGDGLISGINVTPLVDITLVLLIIFMVTAKIIVSNSLLLDLPKAAKGETVQQIFALEVDNNGKVSIDGEAVKEDSEVLSKAKKALAKNKELRAVIRADKGVQHGRVVRLLDLLKQAGVSKIAIGVTPIAAESGSAPKDAEPAAATP